jgi:hypothetical protein
MAGLAAVGCGGLLPGTASGQTTTPSPMSSSAKKYDMREFINWITNTFEPSIKLPGAGHYSRTPGGPLDLYAVDDMACVMYTIGKLKRSDEDRAQWSAAFHEFQVADTGWFIEKNPTHTPLHNLAFTLAAMELLDLRPKNRVILGSEYADIKGYLSTLNWKTSVYPESHKGAGIGSVHALLPEYGTKDWFDRYFAHCDSLVDPNNGMMGQEKPAGGDFDQIGGTFHYFFNYNHFNRKMAYPEKRIDAILGIQRPDGHWDTSNKTWLTLDGIYMLTRTLRQSPHRFEDVKAAIHRVLGTLMETMYSPEGRKTAFAGRLPPHTLTCAVSILAEAQQFFGADVVITDAPLKLVLDRRPFI